MTTAVQSMEISEKELEVRPNSISDVKVDASFRKVSKTAICFHIWKIDEDRLEAVSKTQFGTFYDDCAYILYASCMNGTVVTQDTITREAKSTAGLERFIHFWLGERVSAQKKANASHKVMELDSYFDNIATEYRESQDNESARFLSYFKNGMTVLSGALAAITPPCRLYQLQGREFIRCTEVEPINWDNFSSDYVMILNTETHLFLWNGRASSLAERSKSLDVARKLQQHRELVIIDDGYEQSMAHSRKTIWNAFLPLHQRIVNQLPRRNAKPQIFHFRLYSCRYKGSRYWFEQIKSTVPCQEDLQDSNCVYMLDGFSLGVWLWVGSQTAKVENIEAMRNGRGFIKKKKYPTSTSLVRVVEGHEPLEFTRFFPTWTERIDSASSKTKGLLGKFDSLILSQRPRMAAESQLIDDGTGERCVLRVNEDHLEEVPAPKQCIFFSDNCYIIEYTVGLFDSKRIDKDTIGIGKILYQWFGNECTQRAINKCERFAKERFGKLGEKSMLVQMNQGDETPHFLQIFAGRLTIINGDKNNNDEMNNNNNNNNNSNNNHSNGNENNKTGNNSINQQLPETFALKVIGDASYNSFAIEMNPLVSMSYKECFVIKTHKIWVWCGQSSTGDARETAKNIGSIFGEITLIMEGKEPKEFWLSISENLNQMVVVASETSLNNSVNVNNKSSYPTSPTAVNSSTNGTAANGLREPVAKSRVQLLLIYISGGGGSGGSINAAGDIYTQEIFGFEQSDLCPENVYMLDTGKVIFVWLGERSPTVEQENYTKMVQFYLDNTPGSRRMTSALALVRQYNEPNVFKGFFNEWDHLFWSKSESYENKRKNLTSPHDLNAANQSMTNGNNVDGSPSSISNYGNDFDKHPKFPLQILQQETDLLPPEVSPVKREVYLTHDDFVALFNITYWEFTILPMWKQQDLKKKFKLF